MSFRSRLTLFFVAIVIVPMVSMAIVLFRLLSDNESGKADARIAARQQTAINLYGDVRSKALRTAQKIGSTDQELATPLRQGRRKALGKRVVQLRSELGVARIVVRDASGRTLADAGSKAAAFPATLRL